MTVTIDGVLAVWSKDRQAFVSGCPTLCDADCDLNRGGCHEHHQVPSRRDHDPAACETRQRPTRTFAA